MRVLAVAASLSAVSLAACDKDTGSASSGSVARSGSAVISTAPASTTTSSQASPSFCNQLNASSALHGLPSAIKAIAASADSASGVTTLQTAARDLRAAAKIAPKIIAGNMRATAQAIDVYANDGLTDQGVSDALVNQLSLLGTVVQAECHYALGN
ncbi:MAG TPA: hypothetical protein VGB75_08190 [Jatrophihabitans sp.]|jgi:hypothetical protein|uniref:hypothetical protein n=1 Tax=Jatrophihabitans sp. TaxID=1932789 RepID=UPI002F1186E9